MGLKKIPHPDFFQDIGDEKDGTVCHDNLNWTNSPNTIDDSEGNNREQVCHFPDWDGGSAVS